MDFFIILINYYYNKSKMVNRGFNAENQIQFFIDDKKEKYVGKGEKNVLNFPNNVNSHFT